MPVNVKSTSLNSPASAHNLQNAVLLSIDGKKINDVFDYEFYSQGSRIKVKYEKGGQIFDEIIEKEEFLPLGCEFDTYLIDKKHSCKNKCIFCFIDQLPKGLREHLYFKDDDERLSFLFGNYITLTNLTLKEVDRIIKMRISPINISVHTLNENIRVQMMKNPRSGKVLNYIQKFHEAGIMMNFQIVLCPGVNDGEDLKQSLEKLGGLYPYANSIAVIPPGLTKFRENLPKVKAFDENSAKKALLILEEYGEKFLAQHGKRLVYPSDEFYILAKKRVPNMAFYDDFAQIENGVGMWRKLHTEFMYALHFKKAPLHFKKFDIVTGEITAPLIKRLCAAVSFRFPQIKIKVHAVKNNFFGGNVNVTGLLTGTDIIEQCKGKLISKNLLLAENMLREEQDMFLDNITLDYLKKELSTDVEILPADGGKALDVILRK